MRSDDLAVQGFGKWYPFNKSAKRRLIAALPNKPGVYAVRSCRDYSRCTGSSDILYIGSAANYRGLKNRIGQYFSPGPTQTTNIRILGLVGDSADFEIAFATVPSAREAKPLEASLLALYEKDHFELPPQNRRT